MNLCRLCSGTNIKIFLDFGLMPLAGSFLDFDDLEHEKKFPLRLGFCANCSSVQILDVIPQIKLFSDYRYLSSVTQTLSRHFDTYAEEMTARFLNHNSFVVEFGSNDGVLLEPFLRRGIHVLGVEPAANVAQHAIERGCPTVVDFFSERTARRISIEYGQADMICANNVFAHIDNIIDVTHGVKTLLKRDGVFVFEVHYLMDLISGMQYDMIYHEHVFYHSMRALEHLFNIVDMHLIYAERIPIHGGSIRIIVANRDSRHRQEKTVAPFFEEEKALSLELMHTFVSRMKKQRSDLKSLVNQYRKRGKTICGYGASGRSVILTNYCQLDKNDISYMIDASPERFGRYMPGNHIPIYPPDYFRSKPPDVALLTAWTYKLEIYEKEKWFLDQGGSFIIPLPEVFEHTIHP